MNNWYYCMHHRYCCMQWLITEILVVVVLIWIKLSCLIMSLYRSTYSIRCSIKNTMKRVLNCNYSKWLWARHHSSSMKPGLICFIRCILSDCFILWVIWSVMWWRTHKMIKETTRKMKIIVFEDRSWADPRKEK